MSIQNYESSSSQPGARLRTEDEMLHIFESWMATHGKSYATPEEKRRRFEVFKDTLRFIDEHNRPENGHSYQVGLNAFADLTNEEFRSTYMGTRVEGTRQRLDGATSEQLASDGRDVFTTVDRVYESFDAMGLQENLLRGIYAYGFEKPCAIQQRGIVPFCKGLDVILQAQSGTGKTTTFCSGILQQLDYSLVECQALVLAPTRKLSQQIEKVMRALGDYLSVEVHNCVDGTSVSEDQSILSSGVHVVVGTPDRAFDMLRRQYLRPDCIKMFVLDEADEMLSRGFKDQIYDIFQLLPSKVQVGLFSATMPPEALEITRKFMKKSVMILVETTKT